MRLRLLATLLWLLPPLLGALGPRPAAAVEPALITTAGGSGRTTCSLNIQGNSTGDGILSASLSCTGDDTVTIVVDQLLEGVLTRKGVTEAEEGTCDLGGPACLLTICGSDAVLVDPVVTGIQSLPDLTGLLCITHGSTVTLRKGTFASCGVPPLSIYGYDTAVLVDQCIMQDNIAEEFAAAIYLDEGTLRVQSSTFKGNAVPMEGTYNAGGAIYIANGAATILDSSFHSNEAYVGGAVAVAGEAMLTIQGSQFVGNTAGWSGAAIDADGNAQVNILPAAKQGLGASQTVFSNNSAVSFGADLAAINNASIHVTGATFTSGAAESGGSIHTDGNSSITLEGCNITRGRATKDGGGCIFADASSTVRLVKSLLSGCQSFISGGGILTQDKALLVVADSNITGCTANSTPVSQSAGGAIQAQGNAAVVLSNAHIKGNQAVEGGGMYLADDATLQLPTTSLFQNNTAKYIGGGVRLSSSGFSPEELASNVKFEGNTAFLGFKPDVSYVPHSLQVVDTGNAANYIPSANSEKGLHFTLNVSGPYGLPADDEVPLKLVAQNGNVVFESLSKGGTGDALRKVDIRPQALPGLYTLKASVTTGNGTQETQLEVQVLPCPRGSVATGDNDTCITCVAGLYSFDPTSSTACSICGANFQCPGGDVVWPDPKYWHSAPYSIQMHRCFNADACIGGAAANRTGSQQADFKTAQGSEPYKGNLCGECKQGFGKVHPFFCRKCMSKAAILALYLLAVVAMIGLVKLLVYFQKAAEDSPRTDLQTVIPAEMLRALVIHTQWLYIICNIVGIPWPTALTVPMQVIGGIWSSTSGSSIGFECILWGTKGLPIAAQKLLICLLTPVGILCVVLAIEAAVRCLRAGRGSLRRKPVGALRHNFAGVAMCIVFMFLPTWVSTALSLFTCVPLDTPAEAPYQAEAVGSWWAEDMSQLCYDRSGYHRGWALGLGIPLTLLFCVALPAGVFMFMWFSRKQGKLQHTQFRKHYGFMYRLWRDEWCWWESVVALETISLVMVSTFGFSLGPFYQTIITSAVLAAAGMLLLAVKPFKCPAAGRVAVASVCILCFTAYSALTFLPYNNMTPGPVYGNIMGVVLVLLNLAFIASTAWKLLRSIDWAAVKAFVTCGCCKGRNGMPTAHGISAVAECVPAGPSMPAADSSAGCKDPDVDTSASVSK